MVFIDLNSFTNDTYLINKYLVLSNLATGLFGLRQCTHASAKEETLKLQAMWLWKSPTFNAILIHMIKIQLISN